MYKVWGEDPLVLKEFQDRIERHGGAEAMARAMKAREKEVERQADLSELRGRGM